MDFEERYDAKASIFAVHWLVLIHFSFLLCWFQFGFLLETIFSLLNSSVVCFCVIGSPLIISQMIGLLLVSTVLFFLFSSLNLISRSSMLSI